MGRTLAMAMYSMNTDIRFMIKMTRRARRGLKPSIRAIESGPRSLQARSIRRICELSTESIQLGEFTVKVRSSQEDGIPTFKLTLSVFGNYYDLIISSTSPSEPGCIIAYPISFDSNQIHN